KAEAPPTDVHFTLGDVFKAFQPVHLVVPPQSESWNSEKAVMAYTEALAKLGTAMQAIARNTRDTEAHANAQRAQDEAVEKVRQLTNSFNPETVGGINEIVTRLLREPIMATRGYIKPPAAPGEGIETVVQNLCRDMRPTFSKYPFTPGGSSDL